MKKRKSPVIHMGCKAPFLKAFGALSVGGSNGGRIPAFCFKNQVAHCCPTNFKESLKKNRKKK